MVRSWAVTTTETALSPSVRLIDADALPLVVGVPSTVMVAASSVAVGVTVMLDTVAATSAVYVVVVAAKTGASVPALSVSADRVASFDPAGTHPNPAGLVTPVGLPSVQLPDVRFTVYMEPVLVSAPYIVVPVHAISAGLGVPVLPTTVHAPDVRFTV